MQNLRIWGIIETGVKFVVKSAVFGIADPTIQLQYNLLNSSNKRACSNRFVNVTIVSSK